MKNKKSSKRMVYLSLVFIMRFIVPIICIISPLIVSIFIGYEFYDGKYFDVMKIISIAIPVFVILEILSLLFIFKLISLMKKYKIIKDKYY